VKDLPLTAPGAVNVPGRAHRRWIGLLWMLGQAVFLALLLFVYLRGWDRDFRVPFRFSRDSLSAAMQTKSTVDNGWWWFNPRVGAPFGLDELQYPANANVDQAIVWGISRIVHDPALVGNLAWCVMVVLSGLSATWCLTMLGVSRVSGLVAGTLFALTPYALYRSTGHFWLVIYLVPFAGAASVLLASGRPERWYWGRPFAGLLAGCTLLAFNYVYYAFFACFLLLAASAIGWLQCRARRVGAAGALCVGLIVAGTCLNLAPSVRSWSTHGTPTMVPEKTAGEAEIYGLKIRQLVSPGLWHRFPPFQAWLAREQEAGFPLETENGSTRLGVVATVGFLMLLSLLFVPRAARLLRQHETVLAASRLTLASVLLATVGGFGSLFNLLVTPDIRGYNRIAPFIAFYALLAIALAADALVSGRRRVVLVTAIAIVGLLDQRAATVYLNSIHTAVAAEYTSARRFVGEVEAKLPAGSMVFELPVRTYPEDDGGPRAQPYENLKPYLVSRTLRWSYPALSDEQARWQQAASLLDPPRLASELAAADFAAVLVDRDGYADAGAAVVAALESAIGPGAVLGETARYIALDLRSIVSAADRPTFLSKVRRGTPITEGLPPCQGQTIADINRLGSASAPFGPKPVRLTRGRATIEGWAVDRQAAANGAGVDVLLDGNPIPTIYGIERPDVASAWQQPRYRASGFRGALPASRLGAGSHTLFLRVASIDVRCYYETPALALMIP
jgi:phosphoglycerol transferase